MIGIQLSLQLLLVKSLIDCSIFSLTISRLTNTNSGIANTMDLPEKLLPRISSRMGIQRLCFGPYNYQQLQEIILSRLKGIDAFEKQAIEFASRKVSCMLFVSS